MMSNQEIFIFVFGVFVTMICLGPYLLLAVVDFEGKDDKK